VLNSAGTPRTFCRLSPSRCFLRAMSRYFPII
jgi:hypothetical protein